ncbi:MAG: OadG family protein [Clostridia bacterium]|nr:OadG family protein [Clostridia bacterium]
MNFLTAVAPSAEVTLPVDKAVSEGLFTTAYGLSTVFVVLIIIMVCIFVMRFFFSVGKKKQNGETANVAIPVSAIEVTDAELIAVLTAAICASTGASKSDIIIRSFRRVGKNNSWGSMGVKDQLNKSL